MKIVIEVKLPSLNEHDLANRINRYRGAQMKRSYTELVYWTVKAQKIPKVKTYPVVMTFTWYRRDKRTDPDNISFARKYILDGLVKAGVLENDGWGNISEFHDYFRKGKINRVEIEIEE